MLENQVKASFKGLIPFIVFIVIYLGAGMILQSQGVELAFYQLPGRGSSGNYSRFSFI